jgi:hypothetical protein
MRSQSRLFLQPIASLGHPLNDRRFFFRMTIQDLGPNGRWRGHMPVRSRSLYFFPAAIGVPQ